MQVHAQKAFVLGCGVAAALLIAGTMSLIDSRPASATAAFAAKTGKPCTTCHENPAGGGKLKAAGQKFKDGGYK